MYLKLYSGFKKNAPKKGTLEAERQLHIFNLTEQYILP